MNKRRRKPLKIVILSGGSGRTGSQVLQASLAQFEEEAAELVVKPRVRSVKAATNIIEWAQQENAVVCHTVVEPKLREAIVRECDRREVSAVDLLGPALTLLADHLEATPHNRPGLSYELNREQFDRMDAVDFTLAHDDGARVKTLKEADVVLAGVSRVAKSVTCFFLAYRGIRAANVPIVQGIVPPKELLRLPPGKVIGLTMNPHRLQSIREARRGAIQAAHLEGYSELREVTDELRYANSIISEHNWQTIDVSYKAVEEVAEEVIELAGL